MGNETKNKIDEIHELVEQLNKYRDAYYNHSTSLVEDEVYDNLFDRLSELEQETGLILATSPTQTVGYEVVDGLEKIEHNHPMLSLDKTKDVKDILKFIGDKDWVIMAKMDGLTCSVRYVDGNLVSAETRGNGQVGENILHCAKTITNLPLHINCKEEVVVDGEVIVDYNTFNSINASLPDNEKYHHPRNLASGSIRQLDSKIAAQRGLKFIAWKMLKGTNSNSFSNRIEFMKTLGFTTVPIFYMRNDATSEETINICIDNIKNVADHEGYPIDGCVFGYDDVAYGDSLGATGHHLRGQYAFKMYDEVFETTLRDIEWSTSRTGQINPVAIFDEIDLDGALTTRATLHNISVMKELNLGIGDTITVYRANQVIPKVHENLTKSNNYHFPTVCPCCGEPVEIRKDGIAEVMYCTNKKCPAKLLSSFVHFVSKPCMNIDGLSEATLEKLIGEGFIKTYKDIYHLADYKREIINLEGFGGKSYNKLIDAIEKSRNVKLENFLNALGIPLIGKTASKTIAKSLDEATWDEFINLFETNFDFTNLEDFGKAMNDSLWDWYRSRCTVNDDGLDYGIVSELNFVVEEKTAITNDFIGGKVFVVTGAFNTMKRGDIEKIITDRGGKLSGSVSKKTDYLLTNDANSGSSKAKKAAELGTLIMDEEEFLKRIGK